MQRQLVIYWIDQNGLTTKSRDYIKSTASDADIKAYVDAAAALSNAGVTGYAIEDVLGLAGTAANPATYFSCIDQLKMTFITANNNVVVQSIPAPKQSKLQPNNLDVAPADSAVLAYEAAAIAHLISSTSQAVVEFKSGIRQQGKVKHRT